MRTHILSVAIAALALATPIASHALLYLEKNITFDDVQSGSDISTTYLTQAFVSFQVSGQPGVYVTDTTPYPNYTPLTAPSGTNVLDGSQGDIQVLFDTVNIPDGVDTVSFDIVSDPDLYPSGSSSWIVPVSFYDNNDQLIGQQSYDQSLSQSFSYTGTGIRKVVLPGYSYFDNLKFSGQMVPEPGIIATLLAGLAAGPTLLRRRRA